MAQAFDDYQRNNNTTANFQDSTQAIAQGAGVLTVDFSQGSVAIITLSGNVTSCVFSNMKAGHYYGLVFVQDGTGSRTVANVASNMRWPGTTYLGTTPGSFPTLTTTAGKRDIFYYFFDGTSLNEIHRLMNNT